MDARRTIVLTALLALLIPAAGVAQRGPRGPLGPRGVAPLERWIELKDELNLTEDQVVRLQAIGARLESDNAPHLERIEALREELGLPAFRRGEGPRGRRDEGERPRMSDEERQIMRAFMDRARDDMRAVGDNSRHAMGEARDVLTDAQRETLRARMRSQRGERGERGMRGPRGRKPEGGR